MNFKYPDALQLTCTCVGSVMAGLLFAGLAGWLELNELLKTTTYIIFGVFLLFALWPRRQR